MSTELYNEVELNGKPYEPGRWKEYAVHDDTRIAGFFGQYRFLSNFEPCQVYFEGIMFPSAENAYQAAKTLDRDKRFIFVSATPSQAKKLGNNLELRPNWESNKYFIMRDIVRHKFDSNYSLFSDLMATKGKALIEKNHWNDTFWGQNLDNKGDNNLGKILRIYRDQRL